MLERDAEELFDVTAKGLTFFGEQFAMPFPQPRYDQVFAPEMGGAMENYGCVTWSDTFIFRNPPSYAERERRALVLLHEMAHMWFGDMVTMRWWDDLWLNESFAEWACGWAAVSCTEFTDMWAGMLAGEKQDAYAADAGAHHAPDPPGARRRRDRTGQLRRHHLSQGRRGAQAARRLSSARTPSSPACAATSAATPGGTPPSTTWSTELAAASGRDLTGWVEGWLETSGTDRLTVELVDGGLTLVATPPEGRGPLPHSLRIGAYADRGDAFALVDSLSVEVAGARTRIEPDVEADLWLVNDDDLTFAAVRPDPASLQLLLARGGHLPSAVARTLAVTTAWRLLYDGELTTEQFVECGVHVLRHETADSVIEPLIFRLVDAADLWAPLSARDGLLSRVADLCVSLADDPDRRVAALRGLANSATTPAHLDLLTAEATDADLRWRRLVRLAELDRLDDSEVTDLLSEDPNPDAWMSALQARTARPSAEAKAEAWQVVVEDRKIPPGVIRRMGRSFWRPGQEHLVTPYAEKFLESLGPIGDSGMVWALSMSFSFYPMVGGGEGFLDRLDAAAGDDGVSPVVRQTVRDLGDRRRRWEAARHVAGE